MASLIATIASGLNGWLTYEQMIGNARYHDESAFYPCITAIGRANGYGVFREFSLPMSAGQRGAPKKLDFLMFNRTKKEIWLIEVKYKKLGRTMAGSISQDAKKLIEIDAKTINKSRKNVEYARMPVVTKNYTIHRSVIFIWRNEDVVKYIKKYEDRNIAYQIFVILKNIFEEPKKVTSRMLAEAFLKEIPVKQSTHKFGCLRFGGTKTHNRYWVAALNERQKWRMIN